MKVFSQLERAQFENLGSDPGQGVTGRVWVNTGSSLAKFDDGAAIRTFVTLDNTQTLTNKSLSDSTTSLINVSDATKIAKFQLSGITTGNTRTFTFRDETGTLISMATPLGTKGDILAFSTTNVLVGIGSDGQVLTADSASTPGLKWSTPTAAPVYSSEIYNLGLAISVATNAMTIALKQSNGSTDPSTGASAVKIAFRDATATNADANEVSTTGALSVVIPSGTTIGTISSATHYIYVYAINNAGTVALGVSLALLDEGTIQSSSAISGGATASVLYSTSALTSKAIRLLGRIKVSEGTAGTWATAASEVSLAPFLTVNRQTLQQVLLNTGNGVGAVNTKIRKFSNNSTSGTAITYATSSNSGASLTVNEAGIYAVTYGDNSTGADLFGLSLNSTHLTTNVQSLTANSELLTIVTLIGSSNPTAVSWVGALNVGDVIRPHTNGISGGTNSGLEYMQMTKIG